MTKSNRLRQGGQPRSLQFSPTPPAPWRVPRPSPQASPPTYTRRPRTRRRAYVTALLGNATGGASGSGRRPGLRSARVERETDLGGPLCCRGLLPRFLTRADRMPHLLPLRAGSPFQALGRAGYGQGRNAARTIHLSGFWKGPGSCTAEGRGGAWRGGAGPGSSALFLRPSPAPADCQSLSRAGAEQVLYGVPSLGIL